MCVCVCVCIKLGHFAVQQILTEHCKSTIILKKTFLKGCQSYWITYGLTLFQYDFLLTTYTQ